MANLLTRYDLEKFNWKPFEGEGTPKGCVRRLGGGEQTHHVQNKYFKGINMGFLAVTVDLHDSVSVTKLGSSAQECWCSLRFQFPNIAASLGGSDELPTLTYTTGTPQEIDQWALRTFFIHSPSHIDLEQLRTDEGQKKVPSPDGDYCWMHFVPGELADDGTVTRFGLLFHMHHSLSDGIGIRIMMNFYLGQLAKALSDSRSPSEHIQWGNELENLFPPVFSILNSQEAVPIPPDSAQEPSFDNEYYKTLQNVLDDLGAVTKDAHGFKPSPSDAEWPKTRHAEVFFTKEESARILTASKMSGFTLTHVALSALTMVIMAENPPSPEASSHYMNSFTMFNRRNRLKPDYPLYPGYAVSFSAIRMPISAHLSADGSFLPLDKDMLLKGAEIVKGQYRTQMEIPSGLSYSAQLGEILTSRIVQAVNSNAEPATNLSIGFVSDGKGESFLNPTFTTDTGKAVLSISKPCLTVNRLGSIPSFRISSWAGVLDINADYDVTAVNEEVIMNYLNQWKKFMLLVLD